ncbi:MAG TPA: hypothetical protein VGC79_10085 [Polyangiaceae bacterium]
MHAWNDVWRWSHEAEPKKAAITDQKRALYLRAERDLDVPQTLLLKSGPFGERFDTCSCGIKRLPLDANAADRNSHACVAKRLDDRALRARDLSRALQSTLGFRDSSSRLNAAAPRLLRQGDWSDRAEHARAGSDAIVAEHAVVRSGRQQHIFHLSRLRIEQLLAGERPANIVTAERARSGDFDEEPPDPAVGIVHPD